MVGKAALRPGEGRGRTERVCDVVRSMLVAKDMRTVGAIAEALGALQARGGALQLVDQMFEARTADLRRRIEQVEELGVVELNVLELDAVAGGQCIKEAHHEGAGACC